MRNRPHVSRHKKWAGHRTHHINHTEHKDKATSATAATSPNNDIPVPVPQEISYRDKDGNLRTIRVGGNISAGPIIS